MEQIRQTHPEATARWWRYRQLVYQLARSLGRGGGAEGAPLAEVLREAAVLYRGTGASGRGLGRALAEDIPAVVRRELRWVVLAAAIYAAVGVAAAALTAASPAWREALLPLAVRRELAASLRHGLRPAHPAAASLVVFIYFHNLMASALAYVGGLLVGLGSALALATNALLLGALVGWMGAHGAPATFWALLAPHGVLELPATFCAGGAGLAMGEGWLRPGTAPRFGAMLTAARRTAALFAVACVWLAAAAVIEGLFTPQPLPAAWKLGAAAGLFGLLVVYVWAPWRRGSRRAPGFLPAPAAPGTAWPEGTRRRAEHGWELVVRLPDGLAVQLPVADPPSRALALALDAALPLALAGLIVGALRAVGLPLGRGWLQAIGALLAGLLAGGGYWMILEWLGRGVTPGKALLGLVVVDGWGLPPGPGAVLLRNVLRLVDALPVGYLLGGAVALASGGRRLGDWAAGTQVVHRPGGGGAARTARRRPRAMGEWPPLPLPRPTECGAAPDRRSLERLPRRLRRELWSLWARWSAGAAPAQWAPQALRALRQVVGAGVPVALESGGAPDALACWVEHLTAALWTAALPPRMRCSSGAPRDRQASLGLWAPSETLALDRVPRPLLAALVAFWQRQTELDGPARQRVVAELAAALATLWRCPELASRDPDALLEHVLHQRAAGAEPGASLRPAAHRRL